MAGLDPPYGSFGLSPPPFRQAGVSLGGLGDVWQEAPAFVGEAEYDDAKEYSPALALGQPTRKSRCDF